MKEMTVVGLAEVLAIEPCPPLEEGEGRLVTGTFHHPSAEVYDLKLASESKPIGVTATHPFWSCDRNDWVSAINLRIGETLKTLTGTTHVERITKRPQPEPVYNIEVEGDHVYRIGESGVLVHNASAGCGYNYKIVYTNPTNPDCSSHFRGRSPSCRDLEDHIPNHQFFIGIFGHRYTRTELLFFRGPGPNNPLRTL